MRNLVPSASKVSTLEPIYNEEYPDSTSSNGAKESIVAAAFDIDRGLIFAASEDAQFGVRIWRTPVDPCEWKTPILCGSFSSVDPKVLSLRVIGESAQVILVTRSGDTVSWELDELGQFISGPDVVGSVDSGILAVEWSPDDTLLVMITGDENLILMTSTFDVLSEAPLYTEDFGEDAPINVGWGAKETQFHGSIGRAHLKPSIPSSSQIQEDPDDDGLPRISWRGDGAYFAVSSIVSQTLQSGNVKRRVLRVYSNEARLQSTAETVAGLESSLSWRPSGNLIASTQKEVRSGPSDTRRTGKHGVLFFERNGLTHGGFNLRGDDRDHRIKHLAWSSDSNVLAVHIERTQGDVVQLWTTGNYHWYLKQEISAPLSSHFTSMNWHPETSMRLLLTTPLQIIQQDYAWETCAGANDTGCVGVIDGQTILLTPFRTQNVPPPMSSHQLLVNTPTDASSGHMFLSQVPAHMSLSHSYDLLSAVWQQGHVMMWALQTRTTLGREAVMNPILIWSASLPREFCQCRQVLVSSKDDGDERRTISVAILGSDVSGNDLISIHDFEHVTLPLASISSTRITKVSLQQKNGRLIPHELPEHLAWQAPDGCIFQVHSQEESYSQICSFTELCPSSQRVDAQLFVGLSAGGKVYTAIPSAESVLLASSVNSFTVASGFVIFTTTSHDVQFAPLESVVAALTSGQVNDVSSTGDENKTGELVPQAWEKRRVERGSRIVTAVPSTMSLVLQMPRGNLETINPRPMVMEVVKSDLDAGLWRKAFMACRKHRIDLSIIVEHNQQVFMAGIPAFVEQIEDVDYINLFLTSVGRSQLPAGVVAKVCDSVRQELEDRNLTKYVNSILTAYVVKSPPDHEAGLALLLRLRGVSPGLVEDAVKYIIFLVDADRLFDTALGMYDFSLVLMVAQHAQKDPREYLPFLRELRALPQYYQHFKIDDHLKRRAKALRNLSLAGPEYFQEALDYLDTYQLHDEGLAIWQGTDKYTDVLSVYGTWLFDRHEYHQAATVFIEASDARRAMVSYERALQWQELFELCLKEQLNDEEITEIAYRIADELFSKKRFSESARVLLDYAKDVRQAVNSLVQGNEFAEARRIVTLHAKPELVDQLLLPCALDCCSQIGDDINEMREQLHKQVARLTELRIKKVEEPDAFYNLDDPTLHNVDVMTDVSMAPTAFTRYTVAPSATSKTSKRSSKTKRKMERKLGSGRKGTVDEEEYLLKSVTKLVERCATTQGEIRKILPHLLQFSQVHREEGVALQVEFNQLQSELREAIEDIWKKPDESTPVDSWATRMQDKAKKQLIEPLQRVPKPEMSTSEWSLKLLQQKLAQWNTP